MFRFFHLFIFFIFTLTVSGQSSPTQLHEILYEISPNCHKDNFTLITWHQGTSVSIADIETAPDLYYRNKKYSIGRYRWIYNSDVCPNEFCMISLKTRDIYPSGFAKYIGDPKAKFYYAPPCPEKQKEVSLGYVVLIILAVIGVVLMVVLFLIYLLDRK